MKTRSLVGLCASGLLGAVALVVWSRTDRADAGAAGARTGAQEGRGRADAELRSSDPTLGRGEPARAPGESATEREASRQLVAAPVEPEPPALEGVLVIEVVDASGAPQEGVPVGVEMREPGRETRGGLTVVRSTDATGRAAFPDLLEGGARNYAGFDRAFAAFAFPTRGDHDVELDPRDPPAEPIRLVAPPTGSVEVSVPETVAGIEAELESWRHLTRVPDAAVADGARPRRHALSSRGEATTFPHVEIGLRLRAAASAREREIPEVVFDGPVAPGEHVRVALAAAELPTLVGRLLDPEGAPLVRATFTLAATYRSELTTDERDRARRSHERTDERGAFRAPLSSAPPGTTRVELSLTVDAESSPRGLWVELALDGPPTPGAIDLGDVVLQGAPVLFAGRVVDTVGEPIYWVNVDVAAIARQGGRSFTSGWPMRAMSDHDGRFACFGRLPDGEYALLAKAREFCDSPFLPLRIGDENVALTLVRPGSIAGSLKLADGVPAAWFRVVAEGEPASVDPSLPVLANRVEAAPRVGGDFALAGVRPGRVDVSVHLAGLPAPVLVVEDVKVEEGAETDDPRLRELDLASVLRRFSLSVREPGGARPAPGVVLIHPPGDAAIERAVELNGGEVAFHALHDAVDVDVIVPGYRAARLDGLTGAREIVLAPGIEVTLRLASDVELPPDPLELRMGLREQSRPDDGVLITRADGTAEDLRQFETGALPIVGASREVTVVLPWDGTFGVLLSLRNREALGGAGSFWASSPTWVELGPADAGRVVDVVLDLDGYRRDVEGSLEQ